MPEVRAVGYFEGFHKKPYKERVELWTTKWRELQPQIEFKSEDWWEEERERLRQEFIHNTSYQAGDNAPESEAVDAEEGELFKRENLERIEDRVPVELLRVPRHTGGTSFM